MISAQGIRSTRRGASIHRIEPSAVWPKADLRTLRVRNLGAEAAPASSRDHLTRAPSTWPGLALLNITVVAGCGQRVRRLFRLPGAVPHPVQQFQILHLCSFPRAYRAIRVVGFLGNSSCAASPVGFLRPLLVLSNLVVSTEGPLRLMPSWRSHRWVSQAGAHAVFKVQENQCDRLLLALSWSYFESVK